MDKEKFNRTITIDFEGDMKACSTFEGKLFSAYNRIRDEVKLDAYHAMDEFNTKLVVSDTYPEKPIIKNLFDGIKSSDGKLEDLLHEYYLLKDQSEELLAFINEGKNPTDLETRACNRSNYDYICKRIKQLDDSIIELIIFMGMNLEESTACYVKARTKFLEYKADCLIQDKKKYKDISNKQAKEIRDLNDKYSKLEVKYHKLQRTANIREDTLKLHNGFELDWSMRDNVLVLTFNCGYLELVNDIIQTGFSKFSDIAFSYTLFGPLVEESIHTITYEIKLDGNVNLDIRMLFDAIADAFTKKCEKIG